MGLDNIQQKKNPVLNRPMFARMRDGRIVPVQHAWVGAAIQAGKAIVPWGYKFGKNLPAVIPKIKSGLPSIISKGGKKIKDVKQSLWKALGIGTGVGTAPYVISELSDLSMQEKEPEIPIKKDGPGADRHPPKKEKKDKEEIEITEKIKDGSLDEMITERLELFNKHLGDSKDQVKAGGWAALTEFGLNLASARGGNVMDKIARSAKDPLKTFTSIGAEAAKRADKIKMAAVESGITAQEAEKERAGEMDIAELQQMPDFVKTLEYFETIPELAALSPEIKARLAKTKAVQSDEEFIREISVELIKQGEEPADVGTIAQQIFQSISGGGGAGEFTKGQKANNEAGEIIIFDGEKWVNEKDYQG